MRVVLDTNVLISACWKPGALEAAVLEQARAGRFEVAVSAAVLAEYREVAARPKFARQAECLGAAVEWIAGHAAIVTPAGPVTAARDEDDNRLLECAQAAGAAYLITGNLRDYPPEWHGTRIVNARGFLDATFECRPGCGACCIAPSISSPIPGMPQGKPAGVRCAQLTDDNRCRLFGQPERPAVCVSLRPHEAMCGLSNDQAFERLTRLEAITRPE